MQKLKKASKPRRARLSWRPFARIYLLSLSMVSGQDQTDCGKAGPRENGIRCRSSRWFIAILVIYMAGTFLCCRTFSKHQIVFLGVAASLFFQMVNRKEQDLCTSSPYALFMKTPEYYQFD